MKRVALWALFAVSVAAMIVTQLAVGRYFARRRTAEPAPDPAAVVPAREIPELEWPERDEPVALADPPASPTVVLPPAPPSKPSFDPEAAKRALEPRMDTLPVCRVQGGQGAGTAEIVWSPDGEVSRVSLSAPLGESPAAPCIARRFMGARVPPFAGAPAAMRVSFRI